MTIKVYRSNKRKKTVAARFTGKDEMTIYLPQGLSPEEEQHWVDKMLCKVEERELQRGAHAEQSFLQKRAELINRRYFDGSISYESIRYVTNQTTSAGSCSTGSRTIRISERIAGMPLWVLDYVIVHEMSHLVYPDHSRSFWQCVARYPMAERARGYLMACNMEPDSAA